MRTAASASRQDRIAGLAALDTFGMAPIPGMDGEIAKALIRRIRRTSPDRTTRVQVALDLRVLGKRYPKLRRTLYAASRAMRSC